MLALADQTISKSLIPLFTSGADNLDMENLLVNCIVAFVWLYGISPRRRAKMMGTIQDILRRKQTTVIETQGGMLRFSTPSRKAANRPRSAPKSEPDTMAWIEKLPENAVLWDVGWTAGSSRRCHGMGV